MSHTPLDLVVTLTNGTQVTWTEFRSWSAQKQASLVMTAADRNRIRQSASTTHLARDWSDSQRANHRKAMSAKVGKPSALKGVPGRKWTEEQKQAHGIRQQLEREAGLRRTTKGRTASEETRAKQSKSAQNRSGPGNNAKAVHTPFGVFASITIASGQLGIACCTLARRIKRNVTNYYYI
jgi:hypothetical protein